MPLPRLQLAAPACRLAALPILALALAGCQSVTGNQPASQVRVIDASPDAPRLDIYQNSQASLYNIGFGTVSSYIPTAPGAALHSAVTAGSQQQLAQVRAALSSGGQYTVLAGNIAANLQMSVFKDQSTPAPAGQVALRILDQATRSGPVDLYLLPAGASLARLSPFATGLGFASNTGYLTAPAGEYSIVAFPTGSAPTAATPEFTSSQSDYPSGAARTIVLIDLPPSQSPVPGLQLITADDYDPA